MNTDDMQHDGALTEVAPVEPQPLGAAEQKIEEPATTTPVTQQEEPPPPPPPVFTGHSETSEPPPEPSAPAFEQPEGMERDANRANEVELHWNHLLTGDPATVPDAVRRMVGADNPSLSDDERDYLVCSAINRSWMVDHRSMTKEVVAERWPELRRSIAAELGVADDEKEVFIALSQKSDIDKLRSAGRRVYERAYMAGALGKDDYDVSDITSDLLAENKAAADVIAVNAFAVASERRERLLPLATTLAEGMDAFAAVEEDFLSAPRVISAAPELWQAAAALENLPVADRRLVQYMAVEQMKRQRAARVGEDEGTFSRTVRAIRRGASGLGMGVSQAVGNVLISTVDSIGKQWGGEDGVDMELTAAEWDTRLRTLRELRHLAQQEALPLLIPGAAGAEAYLMHAAETVPSAVLACAGGAGFLTLTAAATGDAVAEARLRAPETPQHLQLAAGVVGGALQASIFMGISRIGGKILEKSINNFFRARGAGAAEFSWAALNSLAGITAEGVKLIMGSKLAVLADLAGQELASRVAGTASNINWKQYGDNITDIEANMREAAGVLPFLLIGAGRLALRHFRSPRAVLGDGNRLLEWGADEKLVQELLAEPNPDFQNRMLREILLGTRVFSGPGYLEEAVRALGLFNLDYFKGFSDPTVVRDFLKLPAESALVQRHDYGVRTQEQMLDAPNHARERSGLMRVRNTKQYRDVLALWDEWWTRSHINEFSSRVTMGEWLLHNGNATARYERSSLYMRELQKDGNPVPRRLRYAAIYAPHAEQERRALLRDRVAEIQDLSYQFLMNVFPFDSLLNHQVTVNRMRKDAEVTRNALLGEVGRTMVRAGLGYEPKKNFELFTDYFRKYYLNRKYKDKDSRTGWFNKVPTDFFSSMDEHSRNFADYRYAMHPELLETYRIMLGLRANMQMLIHLLPLTEDFRTALSRGMSPAQAYELLMQRELGYDTSLLKNYPTQELAESANYVQPVQYARLGEAFMRFTGIEPQQVTGEDGKTYWRMPRPGGSFSRWHDSREAAVNDVAANAAITFLPLGYDMTHNRMVQERGTAAALTMLPMAQEGEFSGYDQLCSYAFRDLSQHWLESPYHLQPGLLVEPLRARFLRNNSYGSGISPVFRDDGTPDGPLHFDLYTTATPHGLAKARFYTYWHRMLNYGSVTPAYVMNFLDEMGAVLPEEKQRMSDTVDDDSRRTLAADYMSEFTLLCFMARLPQLPVPDTVREWYAYAPFCPPVQAAAQMPDSVELGRRGSGIISWSNRRVATALADSTLRVEAIRRAYADSAFADPLMDRLLNGALGLDRAQNAEQFWCNRYSGSEPLHAAGTEYWELLRAPLPTWQKMGAAERYDLQRYLLPFCEENVPPGVEYLRVDGEQTDVVSAALSYASEVLELYPELHEYSLRGAPEDALWHALPPAESVRPDGFPAEPLYSPLPLYRSAGIVDPGGATTVPMADFDLMEEPGVGFTLRLLDALRGYPAGLPYVSVSGIYWNGEHYGGADGAHPVGLESHVPHSPLREVLRLMGEVHEMSNGRDADYMDFMGIPIPNLTPQRLSRHGLQHVTVYRRDGAPTLYADESHLVRLMPGYPAAQHFGSRSPYVVDVRGGVYMNNGLVLRESDDPQNCMVPLNLYLPGADKAYSSANREKWRQQALSRALDNLSDLPERGPEFMTERFCGGVALPELLMRLFEDTNFSHELIGRRSIQQLDIRELRALRLAADILACMTAPRSANHPDSVKAFRGLQRTLRLLRDNKLYREALEHTLNRGNRQIYERTYRLYEPYMKRHEK
ncbi:MAG: hypothetical protein IJA63_03850 [Akkermansia sp.]|nr:hypothetical protein [Akkermansia sp.]